jgi:hypothetical protein
MVGPALHRLRLEGLENENIAHTGENCLSDKNRVRRGGFGQTPGGFSRLAPYILVELELADHGNRGGTGLHTDAQMQGQGRDPNDV